MTCTSYMWFLGNFFLDVFSLLGCGNCGAGQGENDVYCWVMISSNFPISLGGKISRVTSGDVGSDLLVFIANMYGFMDMTHFE